MSTPRTDKHQEQMEVEDLDVECSETYHLARELERENNELRQALSGRTVSCSNCNDLAAENAAMREAIKEAHASLNDCREDTCELIAERDWWKNEPRCGYSARWAEMQARLAKAESTLQKLQPYLK